MFPRVLKIKSNSAVKGSVRKQVKQDLSLQYSNLTANDIDIIIPTKAPLYCVRCEGVKGGGVCTYYTQNNNPILFVHEGVLYPSVYTLWSYPHMVRCVTTLSFVGSKLVEGADLMLPGVVTVEGRGHSLEGITVGQVLAVNVVGNRCPIAVGVSLMSHDDMIANHMRGKFVQILHVFKDHLWAVGTKQQLPQLPVQSEVKSVPAEIPSDVGTPGVQTSSPVSDNQADYTNDELDSVLTVNSSENCVKIIQPDLCTKTCQSEYSVSEEIEQGSQIQASFEAQVVAGNESVATESVSIDDEVRSKVSGGSVSNVSGPKHSDIQMRPPKTISDCSEEGALSVRSSDEFQETAVVVSTQMFSDYQMDELLLECFLKAVKSRVKPKDIPLLCSTFYRIHMMGVCPGELKLDIKKSSYKKVSKFLTSLQSQGLLEISSEGGTDLITSVNFDHDMINNFRPVLTKSTAAKSMPQLPPSKANVSVEEMWSPCHSLAPIFTPLGISKSSTLTATQVREILISYIRENQLICDDNPQMLLMDPVLSDAFKRKGAPPLDRLSWKQLFSKVFEQMRPSFVIYRDTDPPVVRHTLPKVKLCVCRRANKTVTLVDNLDVYNIPAAEVSQRIQRMAACHSVVNMVPGGAVSHQVLIQGNNVKTTVKLLQDTYGLPLKYIEAVDNIKPPKTKKKHGRK